MEFPHDALLQELKNIKTELNNIPIIDNTTLNPVVSSTITTPLTSVNSVTITQPRPIPAPLNEDNLGAFVIDKAQDLINRSLDTVNEIGDFVKASCDAKTLQGFAELVKATTGIIDTLNNINLEKKKSTTSKEIKQMDIESKKALKPSQHTHNTINILATREEIIKKFLVDNESHLLSSHPDAIDIEFQQKS